MVTRREELAAGLRAVRERIDAACAAAGRDDRVDLIAVTKTFSADDVVLLAELGQLEVGENRDQEARAKRVEVERAGASVRWHMIGQLQRNKVRSVAAWADVVHSVDRLELADALGRAAAERRNPLDVLVQVCLDADAEDPDRVRGGVAPSSAVELADRIAAMGALRLLGVMGVAPAPGPGTAAGSAFADLERISLAIRERHPQAVEISAGMSGDLEEAIRFGATQVRVGGAILGNRPALQ